MRKLLCFQMHVFVQKKKKKSLRHVSPAVDDLVGDCHDGAGKVAAWRRSEEKGLSVLA